MEGIPNTPGEASAGAPGPTITCPQCGAVMSAQARFCGACGAALAAQPAAQPEPAPGPATVVASGAPPDAEQGEPAQAAPPEGSRLCNWCRNYSPKEARVCESCGAVFPTPEGDAALEKAARERMDSMQADIAQTRASTWWPFRGR